MVASFGLLMVGSALAGEFVAELGAGVLVPTLGNAGGIGFGAHLSPGYAIEVSPDDLMPMLVPELKIAYQTGSFDFDTSNGMAGALLGVRGDVVVWEGESFSKKKRKNRKLTGRDAFKSYVAVGGLVHAGAYLDLSNTSDLRGAADLGLTADYINPTLDFGVHLTQSMFLPNASYSAADGWLTIGVHASLPIAKALQFAGDMAN